MHKLIQIEGIGAKFAEMLKKAGIESQEDLLSTCRSRRGRFKLAEQTGISHKLLLKWTSQADLARINSIDEECAELLGRAGIGTVPELAGCNPEQLYELLKEKNQELRQMHHILSLSQVMLWVEEAKTLPKTVHH